MRELEREGRRKRREGRQERRKEGREGGRKEENCTYRIEGLKVLHSRTEVPNFSGIRDWFCGRQLLNGPGCWGRRGQLFLG